MTSILTPLERKICVFIFLMAIVTAREASAKTPRFGETLCQTPPYICQEIKKGDTWEKLWPNGEVREKMRRLNRMNTRLRVGMKIAVPQNLESAPSGEFSLIPEKIDPPGEKAIIVDLARMVWGAYEADGTLVKWGPTSGGRGVCPEGGGSCLTKVGEFRIYRKGGAECKSKKYPIPDGGAPMPYCMYFHEGLAIHASKEVPGFHASHGCARIFGDDAKWLNQNFAEVANTEKNILGTRVVIYPYEENTSFKKYTFSKPMPESKPVSSIP